MAGSSVTITDQVKIQTKSGPLVGEVKFVGSIQGKGNIFYGIELSSGTGRNSGAVDGIQYFECAPSKGVFVPRNKIVNVTPARRNLPRLTCGDQIDIPGKGRGAIQYIGYPRFREGIWYGVVLDEPRGKNDGTVEGQYYFDSQPGHGTFLPLAKVQELGGRARRGSRRGPPSTRELPSSPELKKWMQDNGIWKKDLFGELVKRGVDSPNALPTIPVDDIRKILRSVKVANRQELSDPRAQERNSRMLNKFFKLYKTIAGVEERVGVSETKEAETPTARLPEGGDSLRSWMETNEVWQEDLFIELMNLGIDDPIKLNGQSGALTNNDEFDDLIGIVTLAMREETANQAILDKFETLWRGASGVSKRMNATAVNLNHFEVDDATEEKGDVDMADYDDHEDAKSQNPQVVDDFVEMDRDLFDSDDEGEVVHSFSRLNVLAGEQEATTATHKSRTADDDDFWELDRDLFDDDETDDVRHTFSRRNVLTDVDA